MAVLGSFIIGKIIFYYIMELVDKGMKYLTAKSDYKEPVSKILTSLSNNESFIDKVSDMIDSKKGILDIENASAIATSLYIYLKNDEITADRTKFYIQLSVYTTNAAVTPIAIGRGISTDEFLIEIKNLSAAAAWTNLYLYYELVKID